MSLKEIATRLEELTAAVRSQEREFRERLNGIDGRLEGIDGRLEGIDGRLDGIDGRLNPIDGRFTMVDDHLNRIEVRLDTIDAKADRGLEAFSILNDSMDRQFAAVLEKLDERAAPPEAAQRSTARRLRRLEGRRKRR